MYNISLIDKIVSFSDKKNYNRAIKTIDNIDKKYLKDTAFVIICLKLDKVKFKVFEKKKKE